MVVAKQQRRTRVGRAAIEVGLTVLLALVVVAGVRQHYAHSVRLASGPQLLWRQKFSDQNVDSLMGTSDRLVYVAVESTGNTPQGSIEAFDVTSGALRWTAPLQRGVPALRVAPVGHVIYTYRTSATAIDALSTRDGSIMWEYDLHGQGDLPTFADGRLFVAVTPGDASQNQYVDVLDPTNELLLSRVNLPVWSSDLTTVTTPEVNGVLYVAGQTASPNTTTGALAAISVTTGKVLWQHPLTGINLIDQTPVVAGGRVYVRASDGLYALSAHTGSLLWHLRAEAVGAPTVVGDMVYVGVRDAQGYALIALSATSGQPVWRHVTLGLVASSTSAGDALYFKAPEYLFAVNRSTGALLWDSFGFNGEVLAADTAVYVAGDITGPHSLAAYAPL